MEILNHLIQSYIKDCFFDENHQFDADGNIVALSQNLGHVLPAVCLFTWELRHEPLFRHQRHLIERHFQNEWLSRATLYLCLNAEDNTPFLRYFPFPEDAKDPVGTPVTVDNDADGDDGNHKVTFFLYKPEQNGFVTEGDVTLDEMMQDLVEAWTDYRGPRILSYLIVGMRFLKCLQREERTWGRNLDMYTLPRDAVNLEGLEVSEDGRHIRFNWEDFVTAMVTWQLHQAMAFDMAGGSDDESLSE